MCFTGKMVSIDRAMGGGGVGKLTCHLIIRVIGGHIIRIERCDRARSKQLYLETSRLFQAVRSNLTLNERKKILLAFRPHLTITRNSVYFFFCGRAHISYLSSTPAFEPLIEKL